MIALSLIDIIIHLIIIFLCFGVMKKTLGDYLYSYLQEYFYTQKKDNDHYLLRRDSIERSISLLQNELSKREDEWRLIIERKSHKDDIFNFDNILVENIYSHHKAFSIKKDKVLITEKDIKRIVPFLMKDRKND